MTVRATSRIPADGRLRIGIDVGGTFTDLALYDPANNRITVAKVLSTSPDPATGVLDGFRLLMTRAAASPTSIDYLGHASTVASNLVLERNGPRTALITTRGFRDVLLLQRQKRADLYDVFYNKPEALVRRRDIHEVDERTLADGTIHQPLAEGAALAVIEQIVAAGIETIAIALLHSYANPAHEIRLRELAFQVDSDLHVSLSSDISPRWREYERSSTTVMNAYVMPAVARYLDSMQNSLEAEGLRRPIHVMQGSGGLVVARGMKDAPVHLIESGPAAGALMAGYVGRLSGCDRVIAFDMGGTTAKVSLVNQGEPSLVEEFEIAPVTKLRPGSGLPVTVPAVDLVEIGTGGGSIAHLDIGVLKVGPQSAGASPGPACYGFGGSKATVTDADLVLGYLDPDYFLGGDVRLDVAAARHIIHTTIAAPLGISVEEAANAIFAVANSSMANAMRIVTVQKGTDPRELVAVAFGGAGPVHIASIAQEIGIREVIVPANAGIASALGLLVARVKFEFGRTLRVGLVDESLIRLNLAFSELEGRGRRALELSRASQGSVLVRQVRMRYAGQGFEISVEIPHGELDHASIDLIGSRFLSNYNTLYGYADADGALEVVDCRVTALGPSTDSIVLKARSVGKRASTRGRRRAYFQTAGGFIEVEVWSRYALVVDQVVRGPAIIHERESTMVLPPLSTARVDEYRNIVITLANGAAEA